ncbi:hypothetical protein [Burkholderia ubonensis]|uniref:hypothetical protein n=1 Tax=Burkholderia ubonensis TaxID=101571 RepID=UPI000A58422E|nr:hypothetical protein [Burkholderia ubonensis]
MSTEFVQEGREGLWVNPTTAWVNIGGYSGFDRNGACLTAPVFYNNGAARIYVFARNQSNQLSFCVINQSGVAGSWAPLSRPLQSSPAVAAAPNRRTGSAQGLLGVLCVEATNDMRISYFDPATAAITSTVQIVGNLDSGTYFQGQVKLILNENNLFEAFALDTKGNLWHATESNAGEWKGGWDTPPIGSGLDTNVTEFKVISSGGWNSQGPYQVVALKTDGFVYQATQTQIGKYGQLTRAGSPITLDTTKFSGSPAAIFDSANDGFVYAAYNTAAKSSVNPLYYCATVSEIGSASGYWQPEESKYPDYAPAAGDSIVLTATIYNNNQLFWEDGSGQVYSVSRNINNPHYWPSSAPVQVGQPKGSFTGAIASVVNGPNVGLLQSDESGSIWFINYKP